jgi:hypothetical protein
VHFLVGVYGFFCFETSFRVRCRTATFKDKKDELNPGWFELLTLPFNMPTFSETLQVRGC